MGCDIHAYVEYKEKEQSCWYSFGCLSLCRNYSVFSQLAGVRGNAEPIVPLRGFPDDSGWQAQHDNAWINDEDRTFISHPDWHSHSWLTPEEFAQAINDIDVTPDYVACLAAMMALHNRGWKSRIVFWFDN